MPLLDLARIMATAADLRAQAGLKEPPFSARHLIEECFPDILVSGAKLPRGVAEVVSVGAEGRRTILYNRRMSTSAHRVGIVHGLGHILFDLHTEPRECALSTGRHLLPEEVRADLFAGEILVPFVQLDKLLPHPLFPRDPVARRHFDDMLDHAASTFKVPSAFMRQRARDLQLLRRTRFFTP